MSLEAALKENTEAVNTLIGLFKQDIDLRKQSLEKMSDAIAKTGAGKKTEAASEKVADKAASEKTSEKPKETASGGDDKIAEAKKLMGAYVAGTDRDEERKARKQKIVKLLSNKKLKKDGAPEKVTDLADIKPETMSTVIKYLNDFIAAGDLTEAPKADADTGGDDDLDLGE